MSKSFIYPKFLSNLTSGLTALDPNVHVIKVLLTDSYFQFNASHQYLSDVTNEITGTGYTSGGVGLSYQILSNPDNNTESILYDLGIFEGITATDIRAAVIYVDDPIDDYLIQYYRFDGPISVTSGTIILRFINPIEFTVVS